jgi:uncharacterized SAM-binding protein YcdF (DUF218 family)
VSLWWIDLRDLPGILRVALLPSFAGLLVTWATVMRNEAIAAGVNPEAILVDPAGVTTEATVANAISLLGDYSVPPSVIAVSQAYHLPRVQLSFATAGIDVLTVPAADPEPIGEMPPLVAREVPAFWVYYLRVCLG